MKTIYLFYTIFFLALTACATSQKEEPTTVLAHQTVEIKNDYLGWVGQLLVMGDRLYGNEHQMDTCFFYVDLTKNELHRFGAKGQGANEYLYPGVLQYLGENQLGIYDIRARKYSEINLKEGVNPTNRSSQLGERISFYLKKLPNNLYLGIGPYEEGMFTLFDTTGTAIKSFYEYPYRDSDEKSIDNQFRAMAYQGVWISNLSQDKFLFADDHGDILHFYQWEDGDLKIIRKIENSYPKYTPDKKSGGLSAIMSKENLFTYISAYATDQFIYVLYSGERVKDCFDQQKNPDGDQLFVYNWKGEKVKAIKLDIRCTMIAVSPDDEILYAISNNPDPELECFDLKSVPGLGEK